MGASKSSAEEPTANLTNGSMDFYNPKEFDHPKVFDDPKVISNGSMDFLMADIRMEIVYYEIHCDSFWDYQADSFW